MPLFRKKYHRQSDEVLIPLIVQGDERAFSELYERYSAKMHHYFMRMLWRDEEKANDFTQDLFLKVIEKGKSYDTSRKFSTWLYAVAGNMCKNEYRKLSRRGPTDTLSEDLIRQLVAPERDSRYFSNPIDETAFDAALQKAVEELEWGHRQCFILRYQEGLAIKEIAEIVDCPPGTIKSRLFYTTKKLAQRLRIFTDEADPPHQGEGCHQSVCNEK